MDKTAKYALNFTLLLFCESALAQSRTISGTVKDSFDRPLFGANILVEGTAQGTITDREGLYQIQVNANETLIFSYLGFNSQYTAISSNNTIDITLQPGDNLEEVIIAGYNTIAREELMDKIGKDFNHDLTSKK